MKIRRLNSSLLLACLLMISGRELIANDQVATLPSTTLAFVHIKNFAETEAKLLRLVQKFEPATQSLLALAKVTTGLEAGVDFQGDLILAFLDYGVTPQFPAPLLLVPITDYATFAAAVLADDTGEICRVSIAGEELLVAKRGKFAMLMNAEHREIMNWVIANQNPNVPILRSYLPWLEQNDATLVVTATGRDFLLRTTSWRKHFLKTPDAETLFDDSEFLAEPPPLASSLLVREFFRKSLVSGAVGVSFDDHANTKLRWKAQMRITGAHHNEAPVTGDPAKRLEGHAQRPYVVAGGGLLPKGTGPLLADCFTTFAVSSYHQEGGQGFTPEDWLKVRSSYELTFSQVKGISTWFVPPSNEKSLLATFFARLEVNNSQAYLAGLKQSFELTNELTARSTSDIKLHYKIAPTTINGAKGFVAEADLGAATGDAHLQIWQSLLTAFLGEDRKLSIYAVASSEKQVVIGIESADEVAKLIEGLQKRDGSLAKSADVQDTLELLDPTAPFTQVVNPQGAVEFAQAVLKGAFQLGSVLQLPIFPSGPPIGITLTAESDCWQGEFVVPAKTTDHLAKFFSDLESTLGQ